MSDRPDDDNDNGRAQAGDGAAQPTPRRPRWQLPTIAVIVVLLIVLAGVLYATRPNNPAAETPPGSASPAPGSTGTAAGPGKSTGPDKSASPSKTATAPIPEMTPTAPNAEVTQENDVLVSLAKVESVQGEARLPGEIAGPAIRVTVRVKNGSSKALDVGNARVSAYYGSDQTPAGVLTAPGGKQFEGKIAPRGEADGVYLFTIPTADRDNVRITVDTAAGVPVAVFAGRMG